MKNFTEFTNDFGTKQFLLLGFLILGGIGWYSSSAYFGNEAAKLEQAKIEAEKDLAVSKEHGTWLPWSKKEE